MDRVSLIVLLALLAVVAVAGLSTWLILRDAGTDLSDTPAGMILEVKDGEYLDDLGNPVSLLPIQSEYLVITSWASWSPFTAEDLLTLDRLSASYSTEQVTFVAINRAESVAQAKRALVGLPAISDRVRLVYDPTDHFYQSIGGYAMPETVIFNRQGQIVIHERRQLTPAELQNILTTLIEIE